MSIVLKALIDEQNCIGCSKCIRTCPTDAIVGAKHQLHTILPELCTSCENCINACPTNCITLHTAGQAITIEFERFLTARRSQRMAQPTLVTTANVNTNNTIDNNSLNDKTERQQQVVDAIARVKMRKMLKKKE